MNDIAKTPLAGQKVLAIIAEIRKEMETPLDQPEGATAALAAGGDDPDDVLVLKASMLVSAPEIVPGASPVGDQLAIPTAPNTEEATMAGDEAATTSKPSWRKALRWVAVVVLIGGVGFGGVKLYPWGSAAVHKLMQSYVQEPARLVGSADEFARGLDNYTRAVVSQQVVGLRGEIADLKRQLADQQAAHTEDATALRGKIANLEADLAATKVELKSKKAGGIDTQKVIEKLRELGGIVPTS